MACSDVFSNRGGDLSRFVLMFSVTEEEIYHGLLADADPGRHCLAFVRSTHNINIQHDKAWRFIDQNADGSIDEEAQQLKKKLHQIVQDNTPQENIFRYSRVFPICVILVQIKHS